jgi:hypothetical protein
MFSILIYLLSIKGNNPLWNELIVDLVELDENLEFASNIIITVENSKTKLMSLNPFASSRVGEIIISAINCETKRNPLESFDGTTFQPDFQYYHILNSEGMTRGRILAAFHLYKLPKKHNYQGSDWLQSRKAVSSRMMKVKLEASVLGVRRLPNPIKDPRLKIKLITESPSEERMSEFKSKSPSKMDKVIYSY